MLSLAYVPFVSRNILLSFRIQKGVRAAVHARAESSLSWARLRVSAKLTLAAPVPQRGAPDPPGVPCADRRACASRQIFRDRSGRSCGEAITPPGFLQGSRGQTACIVCCSAKRGGPGSLGCSATMVRRRARWVRRCEVGWWLWTRRASTVHFGRRWSAHAQGGRSARHARAGRTMPLKANIKMARGVASGCTLNCRYREKMLPAFHPGRQPWHQLQALCERRRVHTAQRPRRSDPPTVKA